MKPHAPKPVVCGTDFSEKAAQAATVAALLAVRMGHPLRLVHVADEFNAHADEGPGRAEFLAPVEKQLLAEAGRLRNAGATVETSLLTGSVAEDAILGLVEKNPPALVVVSSVSKPAFDRWTLGTVSESLAQSVAAPTLVVRGAAPFEAWARGERALRVFVAADFASVSEAALQWVRDLRDLGPCDLVVAHVDRPHEECDRLGLSKDFFANPPEVQRVIERDLRAKIGTWPGAENIRVVVEPAVARPDARLIELAVEARADLVVVGTHQRQTFGRLAHPSVSRGLLRHAPMSVACVPTPTTAPRGGPRIRECQRVLVAVDLEALHHPAIPYAYSIVKPGGTVRLLHNLPPFRLPNPMIGGAYQEFPTKKEHAQLAAQSAAKLRALAAETHGIATEVDITESLETADAICAAAERFGADIVCVGTHNRPGFTAKLLGSVALAVLQCCRRPVLVVWPHLE